MPDDRPQHTVCYGVDPTRPVAFTVPPVEATPEQPLPEAVPFLRVCAGVAEPSTVVERVIVQLVSIGVIPTNSGRAIQTSWRS